MCHKGQQACLLPDSGVRESVGLKPSIIFDKAEEYVFFFDDAHLLLVDYKRDDRKDLFVIKEQTEQGLIVEYPGQTFTERILNVIGDLFFVKLQETDTQLESRFALGAYFEIAGEGYGAYYELGAESTELVFFGIEQNEERYEVVELADEQYQRVSAEFSTTYAGMLNFE